MSRNEPAAVVNDHPPTLVLAMRDTQGARSGAGAGPVTIGGLDVFRELRTEAERRGISVVAHDEIGTIEESDVVVLWDWGSFATLPERLHAVPRGCVIAWCLESPLVAHRAYHRIGHIAAEAGSLFGFPGVGALLPSTVKLKPLYWPNASRVPFQSDDWSDRKFLTMISTNKRSFRGWEGIPWRHPYRVVRIAAAGILGKSYSLRGQWTVPNLYRERLAAIAFFAQRGEFDLWGMGWDKRVPGGRGLRRSVDSVYRGPAVDKREVLRSYRFSLCYENTVFPGYITEKIFDCFFAGTIPVYLGAPDVPDYVPESCFVDARRFGSIEDLAAFLVGLDPSEANRMRDATREYMRSATFDRFTTAHMVQNLMSAVEICLASR